MCMIAEKIAKEINSNYDKYSNMPEREMLIRITDKLDIDVEAHTIINIAMAVKETRIFLQYENMK